MKKNRSIIGFIGLLILLVFVSGCTTNINTTSNQSSQDIMVQITSNSEWNGTLTYNGINYKINGTKNTNYNLGKTPGAVKIILQKNNDVGGNLTVVLLQGRKIIENQSTNANQEIVTINHNF